MAGLTDVALRQKKEQKADDVGLQHYAERPDDCGDFACTLKALSYGAFTERQR